MQFQSSLAPKGESYYLIRTVTMIDTGFNPLSPRRARATVKQDAGEGAEDVSILSRPEGRELPRFVVG